MYFKNELKYSKRSDHENDVIPLFKSLQKLSGRTLLSYRIFTSVQGGGEVSPRKSVVQSACQCDVTSRVSDFQNGEQSVHRRDG